MSKENKEAEVIDLAEIRKKILHKQRHLASSDQDAPLPLQKGQPNTSFYHAVSSKDSFLESCFSHRGRVVDNSLLTDEYLEKIYCSAEYRHICSVKLGQNSS